MPPSDRSHSSHNRTDPSVVLAVPGPRWIHGSRRRLHPALAGSPIPIAVSSSLVFGTDHPSPAALHPALLRRSCLRLPANLCLWRGNDFHILGSWYRDRTRAALRRRRGDACQKRAPERLAFHAYTRALGDDGASPSRIARNSRNSCKEQARSPHSMNRHGQLFTSLGLTVNHSDPRE